MRRFQDSMYVSLLLLSQIVFSGALPSDYGDTSSSGKLAPGGKCKPGDKWKLDECNNCVCTHTGFASCTLNECSQSKGRPKRSPANDGKVPQGGKCKPGDKWKLDECNNCVCTHTGFASCTLNECSQSKGRPKRSPENDDISEFLGEDRKCKKTATFRVDCNTCICDEKGRYALCTQKGCIDASKIPHRSTRDARNENGKLAPGGKCKPGDKWKLDECNNCVCTHTGFASCTLNECSQSKGRPKRSPANDGKIPQGGKCKPGDKWKLDECNNCVCTHTGFASCTLNECSQSKGRPKRTPTNDGKIPQAGKCKPGDKWKLDECNNCVCTHTGFASCTLNECSQSKGRPKRSPANDGKIPTGGKCKPGDKWKLDECNNCVCTHTGFASCTLNECSQSKGRPKRSPANDDTSEFLGEDGKCKKAGSFRVACNTCSCEEEGKYAICTQIGCIDASMIPHRSKRDAHNENDISEFLGEDRKCKKAATFRVACNTCICDEKGRYALCTRKGCIDASKIPHRSTRDARNENGNSGLECKPGVSWKENCNSCFCSERGIAMCTDIPTCPSPPPPPAPSSSNYTTTLSPLSSNNTTPALTSSNNTTPALTSFNNTAPALTSSKNTTPALTSSNYNTTPSLTSSNCTTTPALPSSDYTTTLPPPPSNNSTPPPPSLAPLSSNYTTLPTTSESTTDQSTQLLQNQTEISDTTTKTDIITTREGQ